jgi:hypothetical protein
VRRIANLDTLERRKSLAPAWNGTRTVLSTMLSDLSWLHFRRRSDPETSHLSARWTSCKNDRPVAIMRLCFWSGCSIFRNYC